MPERYRSEHHAAMERARRRSGEGPQVSRRLDIHGLRHDGSEFPVELSLAQWRVDHSTHFTAVVRDVTERKQAEEEMKRSRERLRDLAARIEATSEAERRRISREIHDELGQALTA